MRHCQPPLWQPTIIPKFHTGSTVTGGGYAENAGQENAGPGKYDRIRKRGTYERFAIWGLPTLRQCAALISSLMPSLKSLSLVTVAVLQRFLLLIHYVTLWPRLLTLNICSIPAMPWSNSVRNMSEIEQPRRSYCDLNLTLWPWTWIACCAML